MTKCTFLPKFHPKATILVISRPKSMLRIVTLSDCFDLLSNQMNQCNKLLPDTLHVFGHSMKKGILPLLHPKSTTFDIFNVKTTRK